MTLPKVRSVLRMLHYPKTIRSAWYYGRLVAIVTVLVVYFKITGEIRENQYEEKTHPVEDGKRQIPKMRATENQDGRNETYPEIKLGREFIMNITSRLSNKFKFHFVINEVDACKSSPELVILVISAAKHREQRAAIRNTWASNNRLKTMTNRILFMIADSDNRTQRLVESESEHFHDILQPNFSESYRNLPLKSVALLAWCLAHCLTSRFVLKVDDDVYVNIPVLLQLLKAQPHRDFILGKENFHIEVRRNPIDKYYISESEYPYAYFPPYLQGVGYVITTHALQALYDAALHLPVIRLEDIYITGFCRIRSGVSLIHTELFKTGHKQIRCVVRFLALAHGYGGIRRLVRMHQEVTNMSLLCPPPKTV